MLFSLLICSCSMAPIMTKDRFETIQVGTEISRVEAQYGPPCDMEDLENGYEKYVYIQRVDVGGGASEQVHFIFQVLNGRIINKQCQEIGSCIDLRTP